MLKIRAIRNYLLGMTSLIPFLTVLLCIGCATNTYRIVNYLEDGVHMSCRCNSDCSNCTDQVGVTLPPNSNCYRACKNLPPPDDGDDEDAIDGIIRVIQADGSANVYGFDQWRDDFFYQRESYISIKKGGTTNFKAAISQEYIDAFSNGFVASIEDDIMGSLSFSSDPNTVKKEYLFSGSTFGTLIPIYSTGFFSSGGTIVISGINDANERTKLVSCIGSNCEEWVKVVIYDEKTYSNYKLYRVNSVFNPTEDNWKDNFNPIIKQAVLKMESFDKSNSTDMSWDGNNNSKLDDWPATGINLVPIDRLELLSIVESVGELSGGCGDDINGATIISPGNIRMNWLLTSNAPANGTTIYLHTTAGLNSGDLITVGAWTGSTSNNETVYITEVLNGTSISICRTWSDPCASGLRYSHAANDVCYIDDLELGVTFSSCSCMKDQPKYQTLVHEFLHQNINGELLHVEDEDNIMYPFDNKTGTNLRKRPIRLYGQSGNEEQWNKLH